MTRSTLKLTVSLLMLLMSTGVLTGCWTRNEQNSAPEPVLDNIPPDPAMDNRQWSQTTAFYTNTAVVTGPTGYFWVPKPGLPQWELAAIDVPLWFYDMIRLPVTTIQTPPGSRFYHKGATFDPTYTGAPPLTKMPM
jgi:hypothetical protein